MLPTAGLTLLIVEPDPALRWRLREAAGQDAEVVACPDFPGARQHLLASPPDILVTNLRLLAYNGLHLVILARTETLRTRCIIHTPVPDPLLVQEAQALGAFFERTARLIPALPGYLHRPLPPTDRRDPLRIDRRSAFRGGRRASDLADLVTVSPA